MTADSSMPPGAEPLSAKGRRVPLSLISIYCLPTVGAGFMYLLVALYLMKFATDVLGISPAAMGTIFGLSRIWDAISDPVVGYWSDRTHTRMGRRRPWILASIVPIFAAYLMLWSPPADLSGDALLVWVTVGVFGFYTAMTVFAVPHLSLGAELTRDHHDRSRIFGIRHIGWTLGSVTALAGMGLLIGAEHEGAAEVRSVARELALGVAIVTAVMLAIPALRLRERADFQDRGPRNPYAAFRDVLTNVHARLLIAVTFVEHLGSATMSVVTLYIAQYVIGMPELAPLFILSYMIPSIVSVPMWLPIARLFGKKRLWIFSLLLTGFSFGSMFFLGEGDIVMICVLAAFAGLAAGAGGTLAPSVQADVIDVDEYQTGERKEGAYFATWNFVYKSSTGIMLMVTGFVLEFSGFVPNAPQTEEVKLALRSLFALFPMFCYVVGALILSRFALTETEHARIRRELEARRPVSKH